MKCSLPDSLCRCNFFTVIMLLVIIVVVYIFVMVNVQTSLIHFKPVVGLDAELVSWLKTPPDKILNFHIIVDKIIHRTHERYLSFSIDSSQIQKGLKKHLHDPTLIKKISHLRGGYLRVGGTAADLLVFSLGFRAPSDRDLATDGGMCSFEHTNCSGTKAQNKKKFAMSADNWNDINGFAKTTGLKLLFDLNVLLRSTNGWNSSNAELLMDFAFAYHYEIDWQLGNEPNSFQHVFATEVSPESLASDFVTLRQLLKKYLLYNNSFIVGPDITNPHNLVLNPQQYLSRFLTSSPEVDAISWHHYYTGPNATLQDFLNVDMYNQFIESCQTITNTVKQKALSKPVWITETGSAYGGGVWNISDKFVASFLWADKLGAAAKNNISLLVRHSIYSSSYSLLDQHTLAPNPDYWVSILYKKLVATKVLEITCKDDLYDETLRVYAHCSKDANIVIFGVNIANFSQGINLMLNYTGYLYSLTSPSLLSSYVDLNGERLSLSLFDDLPPLKAITVNVGNVIPVQPWSIFFLQINISLPICL